MSMKKPRIDILDTHVRKDDASDKNQSDDDLKRTESEKKSLIDVDDFKRNYIHLQKIQQLETDCNNLSEAYRKLNSNFIVTMNEKKMLAENYENLKTEVSLKQKLINGIKEMVCYENKKLKNLFEECRTGTEENDQCLKQINPLRCISMEIETVGSYIKLNNSGQNDIEIGGMYVIQLDNENLISFKFPDNAILRAFTATYIYGAEENATNNPPESYVLPQGKWLHTKESVTKFLNQAGEEVEDINVDLI